MSKGILTELLTIFLNQYYSLYQSVTVRANSFPVSITSFSHKGRDWDINDFTWHTFYHVLQLHLYFRNARYINIVSSSGWRSTTSYTLPKFWRYKKTSLGELVPLEIFGKHQRGLTNKLCRGLTKWWGSMVHLVVASKFWKSVKSYFNWSFHWICLRANYSAIFRSMGTILYRL